MGGGDCGREGIGFGATVGTLVGFAVVGFAVVGFPVVGFSVVGGGVVNTAVGGGVIGAAVVGFSVVGAFVVGGFVVGCPVGSSVTLVSSIITSGDIGVVELSDCGINPFTYS